MSPEKNIAEMKRSRGALITMVTVLLDFSHAFDFSEGQKEEAAVREVHPYCLSVTEVKNIKQSISKWVRV